MAMASPAIVGDRPTEHVVRQRHDGLHPVLPSDANHPAFTASRQTAPRRRQRAPNVCLKGTRKRGEWRSVRGLASKQTQYADYATATFRKDRRINIRISSKDLEAIQKRALEEGLPYQTLIGSLLHKYAAGRLREA